MTNATYDAVDDDGSAFLDTLVGPHEAYQASGLQANFTLTVDQAAIDAASSGLERTAGGLLRPGVVKVPIQCSVKVASPV